MLAIIPLAGQNLDLGIEHFSSEYRSLAGAGNGTVSGVAALDHNPAGLADTKKNTVSLTMTGTLYSYTLFNHRKAQNLLRIFEWHKTDFDYPALSIAWQLSQKFVLGLGFGPQISPYLYNQRRAITWSPLFNQETSGSVNGIIAAAGYRLSDFINLGIRSTRYQGRITCLVTGENHGTDTDKWARLTSDLLGWNMQIGAQFKFAKFRLGLTATSPLAFVVSTSTALSENPLYENLLPAYRKIDCMIPWNFVLGLSFHPNPIWTWLMDFETLNYSDSDLQLNLFEYGGNPNWNNGVAFRIGISYNPQMPGRFPLRVGYARLPQIYASVFTTGDAYTIQENIDRDQIIKNLITVGSTIHFKNCELYFGLDYSWLFWHRDFPVPNYDVKDDYWEEHYNIHLQLVYTIGH